MEGTERSSEESERITIVTTAAARDYPGCDYRGPFEKVQQTKMSLQYGVSAALLFKGHIDEFAFCQFGDTKLNALVQKSIVETDAAYDNELRSYSKQPCRITIRFKDGTECRDALEDVPWVKEMAVEDRFKQEAGKLFDSYNVDEISRACWEMSLKGDSCARLFALLAVPQKPSTTH